jgi:hypothetical protein
VGDASTEELAWSKYDTTGAFHTMIVSVFPDNVEEFKISGTFDAEVAL